MFAGRGIDRRCVENTSFRKEKQVHHDRMRVSVAGYVFSGKKICLTVSGWQATDRGVGCGRDVTPGGTQVPDGRFAFPEPVQAAGLAR